VADRIRAKGIEYDGGGKDRCTLEKSGELNFVNYIKRL
jgi:hypothetical protein